MIDDSELIFNSTDLAFFQNQFILHDTMIGNKGRTFYHDIDDLSFKIQSNKNTDIHYTINNDGFRCDNFNKNITTEFLFAGCSETFGQGGPLKDCWAYMLNSEFSLNNYFNLGQSGSGYQAIVYNVLSYIKKYGSPKVLFILFPNIEREIIYYYPAIAMHKRTKYKFDKKRPETYYNMGFYPVSEKNSPKIPKQLRDNKNTYKKKLFSFYQTISMFEEIMNLNNIDFHWTCSTSTDLYNINKIDKFNNFINYSLKDYHDYVYKYVETHEDVPLYKFDGHSGIAQHIFWKNLFLSRINL